MGAIQNGVGLVAIIGAVLLGAALIYAWTRNRNTSDRDRSHTEQATRDLYREEGKAEEKREEATRPPR